MYATPHDNGAAASAGAFPATPGGNENCAVLGAMNTT